MDSLRAPGLCLYLHLVAKLGRRPRRPSRNELVLWQKLDEFTPGTDFVRWACRVAYFEVQKHRHRQHVRGMLLSQAFVDLLAKRMSDSSEDLQSLVAALGPSSRC